MSNSNAKKEGIQAVSAVRAGNTASESNDTLETSIVTGLSNTDSKYKIDAKVGDNPNINRKLDVDLFMVKMSAGGLLTADIDAEINGSNLNSELRIFNADGKELAYNGVGNAPKEDFSYGSSDSFLEFVAPQSGIYYVGISGYPNSDYDPTVEGSGSKDDRNYTGQYTLSLNLSKADILTGTRDNDTISGTSKVDRIYGLAGNDSIQTVGQDDWVLGGDGDDTLSGGGGGDILYGDKGKDILFGNAGLDRLLGGTGKDTLSGGGFNDLVEGGDGDDHLFGNGWHDELYGQAGDDLISGGQDYDALDGGRGNDSLFGNNGVDELYGQEGDDLISGGNSSDTLLGGKGNDSLFGDELSDELYGDEGDDTLVGGDYYDTLNGGKGDDFLIGVNQERRFGKTDSDTLIGGRGMDTFALGDQEHVYYNDPEPIFSGDVSDYAIIEDFNAAEDFIQLKGTAEFYILDFKIRNSGKVNAHLSYSKDDVFSEVIAVLENVSTDLSVQDSAFIYV